MICASTWGILWGAVVSFCHVLTSFEFLTFPMYLVWTLELLQAAYIITLICMCVYIYICVCVCQYSIYIYTYIVNCMTIYEHMPRDLEKPKPIKWWFLGKNQVFLQRNRFVQNLGFCNSTISLKFRQISIYLQFPLALHFFNPLQTIWFENARVQILHHFHPARSTRSLQLHWYDRLLILKPSAPLLQLRKLAWLAFRNHAQKPIFFVLLTTG